MATDEEGQTSKDWLSKHLFHFPRNQDSHSLFTLSLFNALLLLWERRRTYKHCNSRTRFEYSAEFGPSNYPNEGMSCLGRTDRVHVPDHKTVHVPFLSQIITIW